MQMGWSRRVVLFLQRFWQPTSACIACMPGSLGNLWSLVHWATALQTGLATGVLALLISFTPAARLFGNRYGNALLVGGLTAIGDAYTHANHFAVPFGEPLLTGAVSAALSLAASFVFENRAQRLRAVWGRVFG